ncbi:MAG: hypothetical protein WCI72_04500 [archaeon]
MQTELSRKDKDKIYRLTNRSAMPFQGRYIGKSSLPLDDDVGNMAYTLDDMAAREETAIGAGMHICYERHLSRGR